MNNYLTENAQLMDTWRHNRKEHTSSFVVDGIVDPETWFSLNDERILFFLKEAYSVNVNEDWKLGKWLAGKKCMTNCGKNIQDCANCQPSGKTYNHVAEITYTLFNPDKPFDSWLGAEVGNTAAYKAERRNCLKKIAVVNIKKYSGSPTSANLSLKEHLNRHGALLKSQIELIRPSLIICGGTYEYLKKLFDLDAIEDPFNGRTKFENTKVIATCHPNRRIKSEKKVAMVINQYREFGG